MPGGGVEVGETAAQAAVRETREEAGLVVEVIDLVGVYDSRFCETRSSLQLYQFVFLCQGVRRSARQRRTRCSTSDGSIVTSFRRSHQGTPSACPAPSGSWKSAARSLIPRSDQLTTPQNLRRRRCRDYSDAPEHAPRNAQSIRRVARQIGSASRSLGAMTTRRLL
jgi:ADP-ribose pyrophosphatase YjhB (NUDIX family)